LGSVFPARTLEKLDRPRGSVRSNSRNLSDKTIVIMEVLQLWRRDLIDRLDAPAHAFGFGSFQVAAIRTGGHPAGGRLVPAFLSVLSRLGRTPCRSRTFGRPRHRLEVGAALRPGNSAPI